MTRRHARCDIAQYSYDPPPKPNSCDFDWGDSLFARRKAHFLCHSDTTLGAEGVLRYGNSIRVGKMRCTSKRSGMRSLNRRTDYGFAISRDSYNTL